MPRSALALLVLLCACGLPHDADGTLDRVRGGTLRVGVVENPPWVTDSGAAAGALGGVEGALVGELARGLSARPVLVRGAESQLLDAVRHRQLDVVVAGLTDDLAWAQSLAFTTPYYTDTVVVGWPAGARAPRAGDTVAVDVGDRTASDVSGRGFVPRPVPDLDRTAGPLAAPVWRVRALGRAHDGIVLREAHHVLALPPGENAWLVYVERFLEAHERAVPAVLDRIAADDAARGARAPHAEGTR